MLTLSRSKTVTLFLPAVTQAYSSGFSLGDLRACF